MLTQQEGTSYLSDLGRLSDILALGKTALPEGATNITITPAARFAESCPGGWGYITAYHADPQSTRNYTDTYTSHSGDNIKDCPDTRPPLDVEDIDVANIQHLWTTGFNKVQIVTECPLGQYWLFVCGAPCWTPYNVPA